MRLVTALLTLLALTGCVHTLDEIRAAEPRASYQSARSVPALEQCLAGKLSWASLPSIVHGETSSEMTFGAPGDADLLITLRPLSSGTGVEVRERHQYLSKVRRDVEACL